jgi:hypothetical protein
MRNRIFGLLVFIALIVWCAPVFSQDARTNDNPDAANEKAAQERKEMREKEPSKLWVDLSGLMYLEWAYFTGFNNKSGNEWGKVPRWGIDDTEYPTTLLGASPSDYSYKNSNTFRMQRAYLTLRKEIGDIFSVKVTTDIQPTGPDYLYLKYGFIQLYKEFVTPYGPLSVKAQGGKIATPVIGITDWLSDLRWIGESFLGGSRFVLNGNSFDNSADLGGLLSMGFFDLIRFEYTFTNGEGYLHDNDETYAGKAHTLMASINPGLYRLKELFINFYARWEDTNENKIDTNNFNSITGLGYVIKYSGIDKRSYLGVGAAWYSEPVKIGVNFFLPQQRVSRSLYLPIVGPPTPAMWYVPGHTLHFYLIDSWFNFNLGALIKPAPILLVARCGYGKELKSLVGNERQTHETLVIGAGLGWQFSRYFRLAAYYEQVRYHMGTWYNDFTKKDPATNNNVYVKAEVKY